MSAVQLSDILAYVGGHCYSRYGTATRRINRIGRGGEEFQETVSRTGIALWTGPSGTLRPSATGLGRVSWEDLNGDGIRESPCLVSEAAGSNLITYSDDFSHWTVDAFGGPTRTGGQADPFGGTDAYHLVNNDSVHLRYLYLQPTFTGDAVKALSIFVRVGDNPALAGSAITLEDTTAVTFPVEATLKWSAGLPVLTMTTGTFLKYVAYAGGWYRLLFTSTSITAAHANQVLVSPGAGTTGDLYVCGVQAEDTPLPTSLIRTSGATGTRNIEEWTVPVSFDPQDLTVYYKISRPLAADASGTVPLCGAFDLGDAGTNHLWSYFDSGSRTLYSAVDGGGSQVSHNPAIPVGTPIEAVIQLTGCATGPMVAQDYGAGLSSFTAAAAHPLTAWGSQRLQVAGIANSSGRLNAALDRLIVAAGLHTLAEMRAIL